MTGFGILLRSFRQNSRDPASGKILSQQRLGELLLEEIGVRFSGAAVSDWERGKSKIHEDDRRVLEALIKVLYNFGGLETIEQANQLLEAGNYRALNPDEAKKIFKEGAPDPPVQSASAEPMGTPSHHSRTGSLFFEFPQEFQFMLEKAKEGPSPAWPRVMVAIFRRYSDRLSASSAWTFILWVWVWLFAWWLIAPSLRWPLSSRDEVMLAVVMYAVGSIIIPALIGALTNTKDNEFWQDKESVKQLNLRLYTHQGASIGFHVGYFFIFMIGLLIYNLGFTPALWLEIAAMAFPVFLGYASARLVPYNLLLAYERLGLRDGAIFFVFFLLGPVWAYFFLEIYDILLARALGVFVFLLAITIIAGQAVWQNRRKDKTAEHENNNSEE